MWYGVSSIVVKSIGYLLSPLLTYSAHVSMVDFGRQSLLYSTIPIASIIFTYGFETAYFRFSSKEEHKSTIYSTAFFSILFSTVFLSLVLWWFRAPIGNLMGFQDVPEIMVLAILIIALDTLNKIPLVRLRQEERPLRYAFVNIFGVTVMILIVVFFVYYCPAQVAKDPNSWVTAFYDNNKNPIVYVALANVIQSFVTLLLLSKELFFIKFTFNTKLWKQMMAYALPLIIVGLGGIVNETFDRIFLKLWLPGTAQERLVELGIYSACYKLSMLITLFVQAFKMGAEPFYFKQAEGANAQKTYARVMKLFVMLLTVMFLAVSLFLPVWALINDAKYRVGLKVVPVLLLANIFLGVYYNLSVWYKISNKTIAGTYITLTGVAVTVAINYFFIPRFGYMASAWATFFCYGTMMVLSYKWGQKVYPVPYLTKKMTAYLAIVVCLFLIHYGITWLCNNNLVVSLGLGAVLFLIYIWFILLVEKKEFQKMPLIGKYIK
ncbi:oligosaccharide flippase family protein [Sediminibacterium roseum]|uniref:Oligosaccharide flippase family protein n=1 Tax=Sediminibacterium roseum TaxID=1978412 RepID=A0ABW9ZVQ7_9BACT|nr:oligosaccharide flippase family protein [Sediminibacterium roseum]